MNRFLILPAFAFLAACEGSLAIPDFRGGGDGGGLFRSAPSEDDAMEMAGEPMSATTPLTAKDRLLAATEANGCVMSPETIPAISQEAIVGPAEIEAIILRLVEDGSLIPEGNAFRANSPACTTA